MFLGRSARSATECGSLIPPWCARPRAVGRKPASGHQGGCFAGALHGNGCDFDRAPGSGPSLLTDPFQVDYYVVTMLSRSRHAALRPAPAPIPLRIFGVLRDLLSRVVQVLDDDEPETEPGQVIENKFVTEAKKPDLNNSLKINGRVWASFFVQTNLNNLNISLKTKNIRKAQCKTNLNNPSSL
jgi:hypothetical protein